MTSLNRTSDWASQLISCVSPLNGTSWSLGVVTINLKANKYEKRILTDPFPARELFYNIYNDDSTNFDVIVDLNNINLWQEKSGHIPLQMFYQGFHILQNVKKISHIDHIERNPLGPTQLSIIFDSPQELEPFRFQYVPIQFKKNFRACDYTVYENNCNKNDHDQNFSQKIFISTTYVKY